MAHIRWYWNRSYGIYEKTLNINKCTSTCLSSNASNALCCY